MDGLTTTSYAVLGQLSLHPWNTYELAREMHRNVHYFWPRAESRIYAEVKRLVADGFAAAERGYSGRRPQITYTITPAGREALARWLATPVRPASLEFEPLLRVIFGHMGTRDDLLATLEKARDDTEQLLYTVRPRIGREYQEGRAPFQQHIHLRAFVFDFITDFHLMLRRWAERAHTEVERWEDLTDSDRQARSREIIERAMRRGRARP